MPIPSAREREDYLLVLYFGAAPPSPLARCVRRAYRDLNRTLHGMREHPHRQSLHDVAPRLLEERLQMLLESTKVSSQSDFDSWHQMLAEELCTLYRREGFTTFSVGQAQKWINMSFKYAVTFGEDRINGTSRLFPWLHVPIDNIMLDELSLVGAPEMKTPWSRLADYDEYLFLQQWIRRAFPDQAPLTVDFHLWQAGMSKLAVRSA
jgi:hypothetical protein